MKHLLYITLLLSTCCSAVASGTGDVVAYEHFGAVGDGVHDDLPAICEAHAYANVHGLPVKSKPDATYHLGRKALTAVIATDTDWSTSRFLIDDTDVEDHRKSLFEVRSLLEPEELAIKRLLRDQRQSEVRPNNDCYVQVMNEDVKRYIRRGANQNAGTAQRDCFILRRDGSIEGDIDWEYTSFSRIEAYPMDKKILVLHGGVFITTANRMKQEVGYNYWSRNIVITRSNTEIDGLTHYVVGETAVGHPYAGFLSVRNCANITLRNCFATGHKTYETIGSAGVPVSMGSYDYNINSVVNFTMINCRMNHLMDQTRWGIIGTNFCKNIVLEDCQLSRMDTHMGVSGKYVIRRCTLGYRGLNAIGRGLLLVEDSTVQCHSLISFRGDYGSTWEGDVIIRNSRWIPGEGGAAPLEMFHVNNDGQHDFGYSCYMPRQITIEGLYVDDSNRPDDYEGLFFFRDPGGDNPSEAPFPYKLCETLIVRGLDTASGRKPRVSLNPSLEESLVLIQGSDNRN